MKRTLALTTLALFSGALALATVDEPRKEPARLALGAKAVKTDVMMESVDGKKHSIDSVAGKHGTLVIFSCNHCPWVVKWEDRIASLGNEYRKKGFGVIVINSNDPSLSKGDDLEAMKKRAKERSFEFPYVVDTGSAVARAFGATRTPEVFLFDKDKKLAFYGAIDDNADDASKVEKHYLKDAFDALEKGETPATQETKAFGCTIKFGETAKQS
jgi:peroxiredoxin